MRTVSVFMDVEDPINPAADDAALDFAQLFTSAGVPGSFFVTGEKCRTLMQRGRIDVLEALRPHAHGLHTDTHSFHPSTMEMLADCEFAEGCARAKKTELRGAAAFEKAFGRPAVCWGGGGNTWGPEITEAIKAGGMAGYAYALTAAPNLAVHRFNGVFGLPQAFGIGERDWMDDSRADQAAEVALRLLEEISQPWVGIFVGHPTRMRHMDFWDVPYYAGRTPLTPEFTPLVPDAAYDRAKANLTKFLGRLRANRDVISVADAMALPWRLRRPTPDERESFAEQTAANLRGATGWPIHRAGLSGEKIVEKTLALADTLEIAEIAS